MATLFLSGTVDVTHLRALYDACDACAMPSLLESQSSAHLEAMQWGKPQVVADLPYARDICNDAAIYANAEDPRRLGRQDAVARRRCVLARTFSDGGHSQIATYPRTWSEVGLRIRTFLSEVANGR